MYTGFYSVEFSTAQEMCVWKEVVRSSLQRWWSEVSHGRHDDDGGGRGGGRLRRDVVLGRRPRYVPVDDVSTGRRHAVCLRRRVCHQLPRRRRRSLVLRAAAAQPHHRPAEAARRSAGRRIQVARDSNITVVCVLRYPFGALTPLIGWQEERPACKKNLAPVIVKGSSYVCQCPILTTTGVS